MQAASAVDGDGSVRADASPGVLFMPRLSEFSQLPTSEADAVVLENAEHG